MSKRIISLILAFALFTSCCPVLVHAAEETACTLEVSSVYAAPGSTVEVKVNIQDNPGILGATLTISWDEGLNMVDCKNGEAFSELTMVKPSRMQSGCKIVWYGTDTGDIVDGTILKMYFTVPEGAKDADAYGVRVSYIKSDIADADGNSGNIALNINNGSVYIITYTPGDVNSDDKINPTDLVTLAKYISDGCITDPDGYNVAINESAADVNDDGKINPSDLVLMAKYISDGCVTDPDGYNVALKPSTPKCSHTMETVAYKAPTCTEDGNYAYYHCTTCGKNYNDSDGSKELATTVMAATGHNEVIDPAVEPTYDDYGWTEGSHCSICNETLKAQKRIDKLQSEEYLISYKLPSADTYLEEINAAEANTNPTTYTANKGIDHIEDLEIPGYRFHGWYTAPEGGGTRIDSIPVGTTGNKTLYAHMEPREYKITFDSPQVPIDAITYTVDTGATLTNPSHFGYTFVGWSMDGKIMTSIPVGTTGNITLRANWTSDRNMAVAVSDYGKPVIIEDMVNGQYLFIYEIGTIQNVPLAIIENLGNNEVLELNQTYEFTQSVDKTFTSTISQTLSKATTTTSSWTLSEDWNDSTSASNEHEEEIGKTKETIDSQGNIVEGKYYISNVEGGSTSTTKSAGGSSETSAKITEGASTGISGSYTRENEKSVSVGVEAGISASASTEVGASAGPASAKAGYSIEASISASAEASQSNKQAATVGSERNVNFGTEYGSSSEAHWDTSNTSSSEWNTTRSYEAAASTSKNTEVSNAISQVIYDKYGYSSTIDRGGSNSTTQSSDNSTAETKEYSSTVEYSVGESHTYTSSMTRTYTTTGWYRLVSAGTVHVFAVVGYDVATNSYFTYTYNVLDSERHIFLDYSKSDSTFRDCENAILPFEVPYSVHEFVSGAIAKSSDLEIDEKTGLITSYDGNAEYVLIPEYVSTSDGVDRPYAVQVTGIASDAFAGNTTIKGVYLPKYVGAIPTNAFAGCTSLELVIGYGITKVGEGAFRGCKSLKSFNVDKYITALGDEAFVDVPEVKVVAANERVADAATKSGAKRITVDISGLSAYDNRVISVPNTTEYFAIAGNSSNNGGVTYKNLRIESDAAETFISNMTFVDNKHHPLKLSSAEVTLSKVTVEKAPGFALVLTGDNVNLDLYGTINLQSASGNAVISKNVTLAKSNANVAGELKLDGNYLVCGSVTNSHMMSFASGKVINLSASEYENMLTSSVLTLDPNGGQVSNTEKRVYYGQGYGDLPTPTRTGYNFTGWYTAKSGGTKVTSNTIVTMATNHTLYAQWSAMAYKVSWNTGTGYTISVNRTSSPYAGASTGNLSSGATVYYGDVLSVTYTASTGYSLSNKGSTSVTVTGDVNSSVIYASAKVNSYTVSWGTGEGYTITVKRTSSPKAGASIGSLSSGATVYHGDVLSITYTKKDYYTITGHGADSITVTGNVTSSNIYATAKLNDVKGWVKASEVPSGAQTVEQKWSYTKTTNAESRDTHMDGFTQVGSYWVQCGNGSVNYAGFPGGFDTGHWIYTSFAKEPYYGYENATSKREVSNNWSGFVYWHWMYNVAYHNVTNRTIADRYTNFGGLGYYYFYAMTSGADCPSLGNSYVAHYNPGSAPTTYNCHSILSPTGATTDGMGTPRMLRFDYYTSNYTDYYKMFQYRKVENLESSSEVWASDSISNVQKWVKYRDK